MSASRPPVETVRDVAEADRLDSGAFEHLALAELDAVFRLACRLAGGPHEAEDCVQETFLRAFRSANTFTLGECGIRPWLFKILHNVLYNRGAAKQKDKRLFESLAREHSATDEAAPNSTVHGHVDLSGVNWDQVDGRLKEAIDALPATNRVAFLLAAVEGLKYREIADVTEVPVGTVMSRLFRAREMLAARLADLASELRLSPGDVRRGDPGERTDL